MEALWTYAKHLAPYKCFGMPGETAWWPIVATQHTGGWEGRRRRIMSSKATWATLWVLGQPRLAVRPFSQETGLGGRAVGWKNPGRSSECSPRFLLTVWSYNGSKDIIWNTLHISEFPRLTKIGAECVTYCVTSSIAVPHIQTYWVIF